MQGIIDDIANFDFSTLLKTCKTCQRSLIIRDITRLPTHTDDDWRKEGLAMIAQVEMRSITHSEFIATCTGGCGACYCVKCLLKNTSGELLCCGCELNICKKFGITVYTKQYFNKSIRETIRTMLLIRNRWKKEGHPMQALPRLFWTTYFSRLFL